MPGDVTAVRPGMEVMLTEHCSGDTSDQAIGRSQLLPVNIYACCMATSIYFKGQPVSCY